MLVLLGHSGQSHLTTTTTTTPNMSAFSTAVALFATLVVAMVFGQEAADTGLTAGADEILTSPFVDSFDCNGLEYGYYADIDNNCEIFHICMPIRDETEQVVETKKYSFVSANGTQFDQEYLVCNHKDDAFPCEESAALYGAIEYGVKLEN